MVDPAQPRTLDTIEQEIASLRIRYLHATWAGHEGEAEWLEATIDQDLDEWETVRSGRKATL